MENKNKPGRPKQAIVKKAFSLRLNQDVIDIIRSKSNQAAYIEGLVLKENFENEDKDAYFFKYKYIGI